MAAVFDNAFVDPMSSQQHQATAGEAAAQRYCVLNVVNSGAYGDVYRAWDNETGEVVAIKHEVDGVTLSTMREITILESLPPHPCVVGLKQVAVDEHRRVLVVMEYLPADLHRLIHEEKRRRMPFTLSEVKKMTKQILEGVAFLHGNGVMHRDLKPANVLIDTNKEQLKICDFGLSRDVLGEGSGGYTPGVVTQWYRAPELLWGAAYYTSAIDMWSVGCIMGEMVLGEVLFEGTSEIHQILCIQDTMEESGYRLRARLDAAGRSGRGPRLSGWGMDLLMRMLEMNVEKRITAQQALNHPWFKEFYGLQLEN